MSHEHYMQRCFELARLGAGHVAPNPLVGCVIVKNDRIIGEGFHRKVGEAHAEVNAIGSVLDHADLQDATLYVSLEPCAHHGRTPPCADLIVKMKIPRVVIGCEDPFAKVNGAGIRRLQEADVDVTVGVLKREALQLNRRFITFHQEKRPFVILKWAETADGFVDCKRTSEQGTALRITGKAATTLVHRMRAEESAILVGDRTALLDDAELTTRYYAGPNPLRIVLDPEGRVPQHARIFNDAARTVCFTSKKVAATRDERFIGMSDPLDLPSILTELHRMDIQSVLVEGGPTIHRAFHAFGLWDEAFRFVAPTVIEDGIPAFCPDMKADMETRIGADRLLHYRKP